MSRRARLAVRIGIGALALILLGMFAYSHGDQSVRLDFGLFVLSSVPLPVALYGSIIVGMLIVLGVSLWSDARGDGPPPERRARGLTEPGATSSGEADGRVYEEADRTL